MSPPLALLLFSAFVAYLLWLDHRRTPTLSAALWIPSLWMLYCASRPLVRWFPAGPIIDGLADPETGSALDRLFLSTLILAGIGILMARRTPWGQVIRSNRWLFLLYLFMGLSLLWSDFPFVSFKRWVRASGALVMATVVLTEAAPLNALAAVIRRAAYILVPYSLMLVKYFPHLGVSFGRWSGARMWVGVATQKNGLGRLCLVSGLFLIWALVQRWRAHRRSEAPQPFLQRPVVLAELMVLGITIWLLKGPKGAYSATSIVTFALGLMAMFAVARLNERVHHLGRYLLGVLFASFLLYFAIDILAERSPVAVGTGLLGRDPTFTDRKLIWDELLPIANQHFFLGVGYGGFWIRPDIPYVINAAHNGYLDVRLQLGAVGLLLLGLALFAFYRKAKRMCILERTWGVFGIAYLLVLLVHNFFESSFLLSTAHLWTVFVFLTIVFSPELHAPTSSQPPAAAPLNPDAPRPPDTPGPDTGYP